MMREHHRQLGAVKVVDPPAEEQISLDDARLQLALDDGGDSPPGHPLDPLIAEKISAAREYCEEYSGRALAPQTVEYALDAFPHKRFASFGWHQHHFDDSQKLPGPAIELPFPPVLSIVSVKYVDADGALQTMSSADYTFDNYHEPCRLFPVATWPTTKPIANAVIIRMECGYSIADSPVVNGLPQKYREAMMLLMTDMVTNRASTPSMDAIKAAENMLQLSQVRMPF